MTRTMADSYPRVFLWITPRSVSTALEKLFAHMDGAMVWHEPYSTTYFNRIFANPLTYKKFPKMKTFLAQYQKTLDTLDSVKHEYEGGNLTRSVYFTPGYVREQLDRPLDEGKTFMLVKDLAFGIDGHYGQLPKTPFKHTFLIRHPHRMALSRQQVNKTVYELEGPVEEIDIGPGTHPFMAWDLLSADPLYKFWNFVRENIDPNPVVIDADDLQNHTGDVMRKYCAAVGIPWDDKYLSFDAGNGYIKSLHGSLEHLLRGRNQGVYDKSFFSSEIRPVTSDVPDKIPSGAERFAQEYREGYKVMYEHRLKPETVVMN